MFNIMGCSERRGRQASAYDSRTGDTVGMYKKPYLYILTCMEGSYCPFFSFSYYNQFYTSQLVMNNNWLNSICVVLSLLAASGRSYQGILSRRRALQFITKQGEGAGIGYYLENSFLFFTL